MYVNCAIPLALLLASAIAGCDRDQARDRNDVAPTAPHAAQPTATTSAAGDDPDVASVYTCEAGTSVAILQDGNARVSLPDGSKVGLARIGGSKPVAFTGSSLYFTLDEHRAYLSQEDESNELACRRTATYRSQ